METLVNQFKSFLLELPSSRQGGKKGLSKVSVKNYLSDIRRFLDWLSQYQPQISSAVPQRLSSDHFQAYLDFLTHQDLPHSTISRHFSSLRRFATFIEIVYHQPPLIIPTITSPDSTPKAEPTSSRTQLKSATNQVAAGIIAAEAALSPAELAIAERVHVGRMPCELGAFVTVTADPATPGHFHVEGKGFRYHMSPVATSTGTVRLEDVKGGAVWLQIANKSMLMNQRLGQRLADECMSPEQVAMAEVIKKNPPVSVLEPLPAAK